MKNVIKIGALSLALIASLLLLSNSTSAYNIVAPTGDVSLRITTTSWSCVYGTSLYIGEHPAQYAAYDMTGNTFSGGGVSTLFSCTDTEGLAYWTMTMQATTDLSDANSHTIPKNNVSMIAATNYLYTGACTVGTNQNSWIAIGTTGATILNKASQLGDICTINSDSVNLAVHIDAHQAVGVYTGELTLNMPF